MLFYVFYFSYLGQRFLCNNLINTIDAKIYIGIPSLNIAASFIFGYFSLIFLIKFNELFFETSIRLKINFLFLRLNNELIFEEVKLSIR